jgi:hypothetical protein
MNLDPTPNNVLAYKSTARAAVCMLGFSGFSEFAKYAGCHYHTVNECLYKPRGFRKRLSSVARIHDALTTRYTEFRGKLRPFEDKFFRNWFNGWVKTILSDPDSKCFVERYVRLDDSKISMAEAKRRKQRSKRRIEKIIATLGYLK